jgi:hypothetical protein
MLSVEYGLKLVFKYGVQVQVEVNELDSEFVWVVELE